MSAKGANRPQSSSGMRSGLAPAEEPNEQRLPLQAPTALLLVTAATPAEAVVLSNLSSPPNSVGTAQACRGHTVRGGDTVGPPHFTSEPSTTPADAAAPTAVATASTSASAVEFSAFTTSSTSLAPEPAPHLAPSSAAVSISDRSKSKPQAALSSPTSQFRPRHHYGKWRACGIGKRFSSHSATVQPWRSTI